MERHEEKLLWRALELLEKSCMLLPQNTDPAISELTLHGEMADVYLTINEGGKAIELLKQYNAGGHYNDRIGFILATDQNLAEDAVPFLSMALLQNITAIMRIIEGYATVFCVRNDYSSAESILLWGLELISGLTQTEKTSFLDKMLGRFYVFLAFKQIKSENNEDAIISLKKAQAFARGYDAVPCFDMSNIRYIEFIDRVNAYDDLGTTAFESLERAVNAFNDKKLSALWEKL